jgi:tyrosinase
VFQLSELPATSRHWNSAAQQSNISDVNAALEHQYDALLLLIYKLFASESDYTNMSCTSSSSNSIENIHNMVHNAVGGYGHMSDTSTSAFDPIFWLHHVNIDRLFAMWQAINPQSYLVPTTNAFGSYAEPRGFVDSGDSNLLPFHSDNGTRFWTSNGVRSTRTFGYTYQEVIDWNTTQAALASNVRESINKLYSPAVPITIRQQRGMHSPRNMDHTGLKPDAASVTNRLKSNDYERQWIITVQVQRFAYRSPFVIDFFVGSPPISPSAWPTASNLIGSHAQFIAANSGSTRPHSLPDTLSYGQLSLTHYLTASVHNGDLANIEPASAIPFLIRALNWRARDMEGCELELKSLSALSIAVGSQVVRPTKSSNQFLTFTDLEIYENITAGKPGGTAWEQGLTDKSD